MKFVKIIYRSESTLIKNYLKSNLNEFVSVCTSDFIIAEYNC